MNGKKVFTIDCILFSKKTAVESEEVIAEMERPCCFLEKALKEELR